VAGARTAALEMGLGAALAQDAGVIDAEVLVADAP